MDAEEGRTKPRVRRRRGSRALTAVLVAVAFATACAPRTAPVAPTESPAAHRRSAGCEAASAAPAQARRYFGLDAALPDTIVVYPRALPAAPGAFAWAEPGDPTDRLRDFALIDALIEAFGAAQCVNLDRVFVVGHSLGAYFVNDVACRMGDRIRAVASVAGGLQGDACVGGTAALLVHHPNDRLVRVS